MREDYNRAILNLVFLNEIDNTDDQDMDEEVLRLLPIHGDFIRLLEDLNNTTITATTNDGEFKYNIGSGGWYYIYFIINSFEEFLQGTFSFSTGITTNYGNMNAYFKVTDFKIRKAMAEDLKNKYNIDLVNDFKIIKHIYIQDGRDNKYIYKE